MQICVWAMYKKSRAILAVMLVAFLFQNGVILYANIETSITTRDVMSISVDHLYFCSPDSEGNLNLVLISYVPVVLFDGLLLSLAAFNFLVHLRNTRRVIRYRNPNSWMRLLISQHLIYFVLSVFTDILLLMASITSNGTLLELANVFGYLTFYLMGPRLVISFRTHGFAVQTSTLVDAEEVEADSAIEMTGRFVSIQYLKFDGPNQSSATTLYRN
ncbi:hypothetical protein CONPUDRAFT_136260 [Coniophora puteana RWD-64-598 SS2]|uniref:Uncharacterized protein n=1 Tax=Coniophora puteana (strain RWD-64-598) TaxID=741705 RepID=A0A5M3MWJ0_CONPW|nr:uncharacterized protein CONPUDRAFT_136260 [Coniophora puteana RWD-64-598 SS2]EIW83114.1 hypothetical protein CONPUDRAFT_136260 [Coniophora puteana RWD-64-598 SS2]